MPKTPALAIGNKAPEFSLPDQHNQKHTLSGLLGRWVVLYFYPKALTPGCTLQAQNLRDHIEHFRALNATVIGVSADAPSKLLKFQDKHSLPFTLLGDTEHKTLEAYGMWQPKKMFGHEFLGVPRATVIINPEGIIAHIIPKASPKTHHQDVLNWLKENTHEASA